MAMRENTERLVNDGADANPDAITGEPGSHPIGTGLGAAAGGAAAGMAAGAAAGPIGAAVGAVVGGVAGGYAGKAVAEQVDPTAEAAYWRDEYKNRNYYDPDLNYDADLAPAYQYGWESRGRYDSGDWNAVEADLRNDWYKHRGESSLEWDRAMPASRDAWNRVDAYYGSDLGEVPNRAK